MKRTKQFSRIVALGALVWGAQLSVAFAQSEISVRAEGDVRPDIINHLDGMVVQNTELRFVISARSPILQDASLLGLTIYSPDGSTVNDSILLARMTADWGSATLWWTLGGGALNYLQGPLPAWVNTAGTALPLGGFQSNTFVDILNIDMSLTEAGTICIDSPFVPPVTGWFMSADSVGPLWLGGMGDLSVGGTHPNAFCITVVPQATCCLVPGDANHSGSANIADVTFMIARIFSGGPAPLCINEADANGNGGFNITDVSFMTKRIFRGGFPPTCPANSN